MEYITIENESMFEETEKRSRFISYSLNVNSSKEAAMMVSLQELEDYLYLT